ncbi:MAG: hypothetical protein ABW075_11200 [Aeromicrobium sp.]
MTRHPLRWENLIFGVLFVTFVANWAVWKQHLLTVRELSLTVSGVLIVLGAVGVVATLWKARPEPAPTSPRTEGASDEEADPQS